MSDSSNQFRILVVGNDDRLAYLLKRYSEQGSCQMIFYEMAPTSAEIDRLHPAGIIFSSLDQLQAAQTLVENLTAFEVLVIVCTSPADEARARELGADACLLHPLTYDNFQTVLRSISSLGLN